MGGLLYLPGALKTMKNNGFHIQKPGYLLGKSPVSDGFPW